MVNDDDDDDFREEPSKQSCVAKKGSRAAAKSTTARKSRKRKQVLNDSGEPSHFPLGLSQVFNFFRFRRRLSHQEGKDHNQDHTQDHTHLHKVKEESFFFKKQDVKG